MHLAVADGHVKTSSLERLLQRFIQSLLSKAIEKDFRLNSFAEKTLEVADQVGLNVHGEHFLEYRADGPHQ